MNSVQAVPSSSVTCCQNRQNYSLDSSESTHIRLVAKTADVGSIDANERSVCLHSRNDTLDDLTSLNITERELHFLDGSRFAQTQFDLLRFLVDTADIVSSAQIVRVMMTYAVILPSTSWPTLKRGCHSLTNSSNNSCTLCQFHIQTISHSMLTLI